MSDRVAYLVGNTRGVDHYTGAIEIMDGSGPPDLFTRHPASLGADLATIMKWMWRVKTWRLNAFTLTQQFTAQVGGYVVPQTATWSVPSIDVPLRRVLPDSTIWNPGPPATREREILSNVSGWPGQYLANGGFYYNQIVPGPIPSIAGGATPGPGYGVNWGLQLSCNFLNPFFGGSFYVGSVYYYPDTGLFYPPFDFEMNAVLNYVDDAGIRTAESDYLILATTGASTLTIDGRAQAMFLWSGFPPVSPLSLTLNPSEFWPYATSAGLPVYDSATGAQLRDPFS